ncbi:glycosyltransferase family 9 protein [Burkholderia ubonensis]|uniref:glycosyltransferase family 9 protein n=1 Tax=Burkholderia ubonensis TaxID=101571 RepID=UPI0009B3EBE6|nr:glycosyltransferase family 9 protein [Burkholderia ubonensis]
METFAAASNSSAAENQDIHWIVLQLGREMQRRLADDLSHTTTNIDSATGQHSPAALLSAAADVGVSVDSGLLHLAANLNLPTILLYRFTRTGDTNGCRLRRRGIPVSALFDNR